MKTEGASPALVVSKWENGRWKFGTKVLTLKNSVELQNCTFASTVCGMQKVDRSLGDIGKSVFGGIHLVMKFIGNLNLRLLNRRKKLKKKKTFYLKFFVFVISEKIKSESGKLMGNVTSSIVKICVFLPNFSWTTKLSTTTSSLFSST